MNINRTATRTATAAAVAIVLAMGAVPGTAAAGPAHPPHQSLGALAQAERAGGGWYGDGLTLDAADNNRVDAFLDRAAQAERSISPRIRAAAALSGAELVGFAQRLKSPDSLKREVATALKQSPGETVGQALAKIDDSVHYTMQWRDADYTAGVAIASATLSAWGNDSVRWTNTWGRTSGFKGIDSTWSAPRSGQRFEIRFLTPAGSRAQKASHRLCTEQRLPGTSRERARELRMRQNAVFAAVPVPAGAEELTAPARRMPLPFG